MTDHDAPPDYSGLAREEMLRASFRNGSVVQLVDGDPALGSATVVSVNPATIILTSRRLIAADGDLEWTWLLTDIGDLHHAPRGDWTIVEVPGVEDHGVSVSPGDVDEFRRELDAARAGGALGATWPPNPSGPSVSAYVAGPAVPLESIVDLREEPAEEHPLPTVPGASVPLGPEHTFVDSEDYQPPGSPDQLVNAPAEGRHADPPETPPHDQHHGVSAGAPVAAAAIVTVSELDPSGTRYDLLPPPPPGSAGSEDGAAMRTGVLGRVRGGRSRRATETAARAAAMPLAGLEAREISAWFGTHHVLDRVSLEMTAGKVTALIGPSGCGKSTFLRILNRMHEMIPSASLAGEVLLDGDDIYDPQRKLTDARRQIGMVFQKPNPFPAMSIYDNVVASYQLTGTRITSTEKDEVVEACLSKAGLWTEVRDRLRSPGGGLSGGQQQRLCIARALAIRPRVLLMDEPCSALDPTSTRRIEQTIMELGSEVTIVIVTHNMQQAARVSDQCAFFLAEQGTPGVIVEHGPTDAMFHEPQDDRTLDYVNGRFG